MNMPTFSINSEHKSIKELMKRQRGGGVGGRVAVGSLPKGTCFIRLGERIPSCVMKHQYGSTAFYKKGEFPPVSRELWSGTQVEVCNSNGQFMSAPPEVLTTGECGKIPGAVYSLVSTPECMFIGVKGGSCALAQYSVRGAFAYDSHITNDSSRCVLHGVLVYNKEGC